MYLSDLIRKPINKELEKTCVGKKVTACDMNIGDVTFTCRDVRFCDDDGNCWLEFHDTDGKKYCIDGQGIDIYFKVEK